MCHFVLERVVSVLSPGRGGVDKLLFCSPSVSKMAGGGERLLTVTAWGCSNKWAYGTEKHLKLLKRRVRTVQMLGLA